MWLRQTLCGALNVTNPRQIDQVRYGFLPLPRPVHYIPRSLRSRKREREQQGAEASIVSWLLFCSSGNKFSYTTLVCALTQKGQGLQKELFGVIWLLKGLLPVLS